MAANVTNPLLLLVPDAKFAETVTKPGLTTSTAFLAYGRNAALPAADGNYAAGVCLQDTLATDRALPIVASGYGIIRVKPGSIIAVDGAVSAAATGEAIPAAAGYVLGRALDSSNGGGTALAPHYIVIKLS
jgi:hypothetical protein